MDIETSDEEQTLARVEEKLLQLQQQLEEMTGRREEPAYMLGWAQGGIRAALAEISAWREYAK